MHFSFLPFFLALIERISLVILQARQKKLYTALKSTHKPARPPSLNLAIVESLLQYSTTHRHTKPS